MFILRTVIVVLFIFESACSSDYQVQQAKHKLAQRKQERQKLQSDLNDCKNKLYYLENRAGSVIATQGCEQQQTLISGLRSKISDLTSKLKQKVQPIEQACQTVVNECKSQLSTATHKINNIEVKIVDKLKDYGRNIKNFLTGRGPYKHEDVVQFKQFKDKIADVEKSLQENKEVLKKIQSEREDLAFQQRYCRLRFENLQDEASKLEKEAHLKGKSYYIKEIDQIQKRRDMLIPSSGTIDVNDRILQDKLAQVESQLRQQRQKNTRQMQQISRLIDTNLVHKSKNEQLTSQNERLKSILKQIYDVRNH